MKTARSDIGLGLPMSNRALALQIGGRAPPLGVSSGPGPLRIPVGHEPRGRLSLAMGGATRVSDAGTRRASTAAGTTSRFGISGIAAKRAAERLAASRREALELRTRLERAERRNADFERSRGEGEGEGDPAGTERSPVGTTERDTANDIERRLMTKERESALRTTRTTRTKSATRDETTDAERSPKRSPKHAPAHLELARARRAIEDLRAENDELRGFARSAATAENATSGAFDERADAPSDANLADLDFSVPCRLKSRSLGGGAAATEREARLLEAIVAATTAHEGMAGNDGLSATVSNETETVSGKEDGSLNSTSDADRSSFRGSTRGDESDDEVVQATQELGIDSTPQGDSTLQDSPASLRRALAALRAELRTQARARAILEEERDAFAKRVAETEEAVRASAAREAASAASLRSARQDALAAAALGEELARSCAEKLERAEAIASAWEEEARRLGKIERDNAERRVIAAAESAEAAAIESRTLDASTRASSPTAKKKTNRVGDANGLEVRSVSRAARAPSPPPASPPATIPRQRRGSPFPERPLGSGVSPATPSSSRDSPFADSAIFADANNKGHRAGSVARSPPSVSARGAIFAAGDEGKEDENENADAIVHATPGEALAASLRRQSATLDALRGARARRDEELRRVRDRLDRLVASPRRVGFGAARMDNQSARGVRFSRGVSDASPPPSARRGHLPREPYDRYADPSPDPKREEHSREARERRVARDAKTVSEETASADPAETGGFANRRAAPTHPSRAPTSSGGGDVRGPLAGEKSPGGKKSLFESGLAMPAVSMPSMSSFGAPMAAMHKAAGTIQSAWRRKKKT